MSFTLKSQPGIQAADALPAITVHDVHLSYRSIVPVSKRKTQARKRAGWNISRPSMASPLPLDRGKSWGWWAETAAENPPCCGFWRESLSRTRALWDLHGHTVSLLALGVGFQTQLSYWENIYLSGLLLGFTKQDIDAQIDEIIAFPSWRSSSKSRCAPTQRHAVQAGLRHHRHS